MLSHSVPDEWAGNQVVFPGSGRRNWVRTSDPSLVSVVLLLGNQGPFRRDLRILVRYDTWKSAGVRGDCRSVSHSATRPSGLLSLWGLRRLSVKTEVRLACQSLQCAIGCVLLLHFWTVFSNKLSLLERT